MPEKQTRVKKSEADAGGLGGLWGLGLRDFMGLKLLGFSFVFGGGHGTWCRIKCSFHFRAVFVEFCGRGSKDIGAPTIVIV